MQSISQSVDNFALLKKRELNIDDDGDTKSKRTAALVSLI
jgi:hypothetical protein